MAIGSNQAEAAQKLEFLGDSIWDMAVYIGKLRKLDYSKDAGEMSHKKAEFTSNEFMAKLAIILGLENRFLK